MAVIGGTGSFRTASGRQIVKPFATKPAATNPFAAMSLADVQSTLGNIGKLGDISNQPYMQGMVTQLQARLKALQPATTQTAGPTSIPSAAASYLPTSLYRGATSSPPVQGTSVSSNPVTHQSPIWFPGGAASPEYQQYMANVAAAKPRSTQTISESLDPQSFYASASTPRVTYDQAVFDRYGRFVDEWQATHTAPAVPAEGIGSDKYRQAWQQYQADIDAAYQQKYGIAPASTTAINPVQTPSYVPKPYTARAASKPRTTTSKGYGWYYS